MTSMEKGRIICGFAGIGKTKLAHDRAGVVDLESTPFAKDWVIYANIAEHLKNNGYTVLLSCHKEIRDELFDRGVLYTLALPPKEAKGEYMRRYRERGNADAFVELLDKNWDNFLTVFPNEHDVLIVKDFLAEAL